MTTFPIDPKALEAASLAMSTEETRYYLCGVHLTKTPDRPGDVCYQATDGHRLFRAWADPEKGAEPVGDLDAIVPAGAVKRIVAYARANRFILPNNLVATVAEGRIRVVNVLEGDDVVVDTRLIDGTFPDAERVNREREHPHWDESDRRPAAAGAPDPRAGQSVAPGPAGRLGPTHLAPGGATPATPAGAGRGPWSGLADFPSRARQRPRNSSRGHGRPPAAHRRLTARRR